MAQFAGAVIESTKMTAMPEPDRRLDLLGHGEERAHPEEVGEKDVLDEDRLQRERNVGLLSDQRQASSV